MCALLACWIFFPHYNASDLVLMFLHGCVLKCPCDQTKSPEEHRGRHWSFLHVPSEVTLQHTHRRNPETHLDLHYLVWSAKPTARQLMINKSPRPLPPLLCERANTHMQMRINVLLLCMHSSEWHTTPTQLLQSCFRDCLPGTLNWSFCHRAITARAPLQPSSNHLHVPLLLPPHSPPSLVLDWHLLTVWISRSKKVNRLISKNFGLLTDLLRTSVSRDWYQKAKILLPTSGTWLPSGCLCLLIFNVAWLSLRFDGQSISFFLLLLSNQASRSGAKVSLYLCRGDW